MMLTTLHWALDMSGDQLGSREPHNQQVATGQVAKHTFLATLHCGVKDPRKAPLVRLTPIRSLMSMAFSYLMDMQEKV